LKFGCPYISEFTTSLFNWDSRLISSFESYKTEEIKTALVMACFLYLIRLVPVIVEQFVEFIGIEGYTSPTKPTCYYERCFFVGLSQNFLLLYIGCCETTLRLIEAVN